MELLTIAVLAFVVSTLVAQFTIHATLSRRLEALEEKYHPDTNEVERRINGTLKNLKIDDLHGRFFGLCQHLGVVVKKVKTEDGWVEYPVEKTKKQKI